MAADARKIMIYAAEAYIKRNIAGMALLYEIEIESYVPGLVDAQLTALSANKIGTFTLDQKGHPLEHE